MLFNVQVVNKLQVAREVPLKKIILDTFTPENGKFFYSIEVSPKEELHIDFNGFKTLPLFVDITWIKDINLTQPLRKCPAFELARKIKSTHAVNSVTCFKMTRDYLEEILNDSDMIKNLTVLRGGKGF